MKKLALILALLAILPATAFAQNVFLAVETKLVSDGSAHTAMSITLDVPQERIVIPIFNKYRNLKWEANFPDFDFSEVAKPYGADVVCDASGVGRSGTFKVEFDTNDFISKSDGKFALNQQTVYPLNATVFQMRVILPDGFGLVKDNPSFLPTDGSSSSDGRNIFIFWSRTNVNAGDVFTSQATYESLGLPVDLLGVGSGLALLVAMFAFAYMRRTKLKPQMIFSVLRSDEKLVLEKVMGNKDGVHQKVLVRESGYSKAKVSKVLKILADRGIVKLERVGRSNKVFLRKNMQTKAQKASGNSQEE